MAIIEFQFREGLFFDIIRAEIVRIPLPSELIEALAELGTKLAGEELLVERVDCPDVVVVSEAPDFGPAPKGKLLVRAKITLFLTTHAKARLAGHLVPPTTEALDNHLSAR